MQAEHRGGGSEHIAVRGGSGAVLLFCSVPCFAKRKGRKDKGLGGSSFGFRSHQQRGIESLAMTQPQEPPQPPQPQQPAPGRAPCRYKAADLSSAALGTRHLHTFGRHFVDGYGRIVQMRGLNVSGASKLCVREK